MNRLGTSVLALAALATFQLSASSNASAQSVAAPPITITAIEGSGTGCPAGSYTALPLDSDITGQSLTIKLTKYVAYVSPQTPIDQKACELHLYVKVPAGRAAAVTQVIYRGNASFDDGVTGAISATYRWLGRSVRAKSSAPKSLSGAAGSGAFEFVDTIEGESLSFCGREDQLVLSTNLSLRNTGKGTGEMKVERTEFDLTSSIIVEFNTTFCPK